MRWVLTIISLIILSPLLGQTKRERNLFYRDLSDPVFDKDKHRLDIHSPADKNPQVVLFIHGGSWDSGFKKSAMSCQRMVFLLSLKFFVRSTLP